MSALQERLESLHDEILRTPEDGREPLLDHLEEVVLTLEAQGIPTPHWAKVYLIARTDAEVEAQFDNLPL